MNKSKKVVILIVEGATDEFIFGQFMTKLLENHNLRVQIMNKDIFSDNTNPSASPKAIVGNIVNDIRKLTKFKVSDIVLIAQIMDTDGIYIDEKDFIVDEQISPIDNKSYMYSFENEKVLVKNNEMLERLKNSWSGKKQKVMAIKSGFKYSDKNVPYFLYFNSLNLEHVTNNNILPNQDKTKAIFNFIDTLQNDIDKYLNYFEGKNVANNYEESWKQLETGNWTVSKSNIKFLNDKLKTL